MQDAPTIRYGSIGAANLAPVLQAVPAAAGALANIAYSPRVGQAMEKITGGTQAPEPEKIAEQAKEIAGGPIHAIRNVHTVATQFAEPYVYGAKQGPWAQGGSWHKFFNPEYTSAYPQGAGATAMRELLQSWGLAHYIPGLEEEPSIGQAIGQQFGVPEGQGIIQTLQGSPFAQAGEEAGGAIQRGGELLKEYSKEGIKELPNYLRDRFGGEVPTPALSPLSRAIPRGRRPSPATAIAPNVPYAPPFMR
jgi:hypothetical protein